MTRVLADISKNGEHIFTDIVSGGATNGLPTGGTADQVLAKIDSTDYNAEWVDAGSGYILPTASTTVKGGVKVGSRLTMTGDVLSADIQTVDLSGKVDKITGKGLSTNDYTTAEQTKLAGIEAEANKYVHPANHAPSIINQDASNRFVSDTEKSAWNGKVTNATHTGDVTGSTTLTIDKTAITGKTTVTGVGTDYLLISDTSDSGNLKKVLASDFAGGTSLSKATGSEINTGTDDAKYVTPKSIEDSNIIKSSDVSITDIISCLKAQYDALTTEQRAGRIFNIIDDIGSNTGGFNTLELISTLSNQAYTGLYRYVNVDVNNTGIGALLYIASDGNYEEADASSASLTPCTALALESGTGIKKVLINGTFRNDTWNLNIGGLIYLSETNGTITQTVPTTSGSQVQIIGYAISANTIMFNPQLIMLEVA